jgi:flagellar FliL protein
LVPEEELFATTYYEFPGNFTTNLKGSKKFLQVSIGVSTQYDEQVMANVDSHQLALRSEILGIISEFAAEDVSNREGKKLLADKLKDGINEILEGVEGFGGVENVHFTSFVLQ